MSRQKCMLFSECPNIETNDIMFFRFCYEREKSQTMTSNKQNFEIIAFKGVRTKCYCAFRVILREHFFKIPMPNAVY